jgi:hypothetical protein
MRPLRRRLFGEVRVVAMVVMAPVMLIAALMRADDAGAGRRRDGHHDRHGQKQNC